MNHEAPLTKIERYSGVRGHRNVAAAGAALEACGATLLSNADPTVAPFEMAIRTPLGESLELVCYAFTARERGRPGAQQHTGEHRFQIRYGSDFGRYHHLHIDPSRRRVTLLFGVHHELGLFVALDPWMNTPTWFPTSVGLPEAQLRAAAEAGWAAWERDRPERRSKYDRSLLNLQTEVVYGTPAIFSPWTYLGIHFFLQERWLQKKLGVVGGEKAMRAALFDVVGAARARISTSAGQGIDEAVRHRLYARSGNTHLSNNLGIAQAAYGVRSMPLIAPSGGWSMPADDLARVVASLDWGGLPGRQPLLSVSGVTMFETVKPLVRNASAPGMVQVTYGGQYRRAWTGQDFSTFHNGSLDGAQALLLRLVAPSMGGVVGVALTLSGELSGSDFEGFRGPGEGDVDGASGGFLMGAVPPVWPSWDLFGP